MVLSNCMVLLNFVLKYLSWGMKDSLQSKIDSKVFVLFKNFLVLTFTSGFTFQSFFRFFIFDLINIIFLIGKVTVDLILYCVMIQ